MKTSYKALKSTFWSSVASLLAVSSALFAGTAGADDGVIQSERVEFPVTLSDNQTYTVVGYLYTPDDDSKGYKRKSRTVQVLLHGGTYNHRYWDAGTINGVDYSYVRFMVARGYAVLALDRLGAGESSKPDGDFLDKDETAASIAQVLASLRQPKNPTQRKFKRIVLVGHSLGTLSAVYTLGTYGNVADLLVATGWVNAPGMVPLDPAFVEATLAEPYLVFPDNVRTALFYYLPSADPTVIAFDNASLADAMPRGFWRDALNVLTARAQGDVDAIKALTRVDRVAVPVFIQLGDFDVLAPASFAGSEADFYASAPAVTVNTLTDMGHSYNLHLNHLAGWEAIATWMADTLGGLDEDEAGK